MYNSRWVGIKESGRPKPALLDSGHPHRGLLSSDIVYTIEGTDTNGTLTQNLDEYMNLITNRLHVRIYSVSRFVHVIYIGTSYYHCQSIRLPKSKGISSVSFRFACIAVYFNTDRFRDRNVLIVEDMHILYITFMFIRPIDIFLKEILLTCKPIRKSVGSGLWWVVDDIWEMWHRLKNCALSQDSGHHLI